MNKFISYLIMAVVSTLIVSGSTMTLKMGLKDDSNWKYLANIYNSLDLLALSPTQSEITLIDEKQTVNNDCKNNTFNGISLVDYLVKNGQGHSFDFRAKLALENNIQNYSGSAKQNRLLLEKLKEKNTVCETNSKNTDQKITNNNIK